MAKKDKGQPIPATEPQYIQPQNPTEYIRRGWLYYAQNEFERAEKDFLTALEQRAGDVDVLYALGLTQRNLGHDQDAILTFEQVIALAGKIEDRVRSTMIIRLARGHINEISRGEENLE